MATATKTFQLELITPDGVIYSEQCQNLIANTESGEIGILPNHADLKTALKHAPLRFQTQNGKNEFAAVLGGILEVCDNKVTVISDYAEKGSDIDEVEAEREKEKAETELKILNDKVSTDDVQFNLAEAALRKEMVKLQTIRLRKQFA